MGCYLFQLGTHLELVCLKWTPLEGVLLMGLEFLLVMAQENPAKLSWHLQNIRASTWLRLLRNFFSLNDFSFVGHLDPSSDFSPSSYKLKKLPLSDWFGIFIAEIR